MCKTPSEMHMRDMVKIDKKNLDRKGALKASPPGSLTFSNAPDRMGLLMGYYMCSLNIENSTVNITQITQMKLPHSMLNKV